jgi:hypothetical protein
MFKGFPHYESPSVPKPIDHTQEKGSEASAIASVRLEMTVLLRLVKHSRFANHMVPKFGRVVGVQVGSKIEVTNAIPNHPLPQRDRNRGESEEDALEREKEELMREQELERMFDDEKFDTYVVGHYVIANLCSNAWFGQKTIENLFALVQERHPAVLIVYDPCRTELGKLHVRCFTLTDQYIAFSRAKKIADDFDESKMIAAHGVAASGVLRELPVELVASGLHKLLLPEIRTKPLPDSSTTAASTKTTEYLEALLGAVNANVSMLEKIQGSRRGESSASMIVAPKIDTLLLIEQIKEQTRHIEGICDAILLTNRVSREI